MKNCPEQCNYERLEAKVSASRFVHPKKAKTMAKYFNRVFAETRDNWTNMTEDEVKELILMELYYDNMQSRVIERMTRLSIDEFISNIGGCVGVWTGISLITIIQLLFYIVKGFVDLCSRSCRKEQRVK
jgi:Amiloride-sensitive sodium channel